MAGEDFKREDFKREDPVGGILTGEDFEEDLTDEDFVNKV